MPFHLLPLLTLLYFLLFPLLLVQPNSSVATPLWKATLPDYSFVSYSLAQLLHHLRLLCTPAIFDSTPLDPTLNWFFNHSYSRITGIDCSCPHISLPDQPLWLRSLFALVDFLSTHFQLSCFILTVSFPADLASLKLRSQGCVPSLYNVLLYYCITVLLSTTELLLYFTVRRGSSLADIQNDSRTNKLI